MLQIDSVDSVDLNAASGKTNTVAFQASGVTSPSSVSSLISGMGSSLFTVGSTVKVGDVAANTYVFHVTLTGTAAANTPVPDADLTITIDMNGGLSNPVPIPATLSNRPNG